MINLRRTKGFNHEVEILLRFHCNTMRLWKICHIPRESRIARKEKSNFKSFCLPTSCSCMQLSNFLSFLQQYCTPTLRVSNVQQQMGVLLPFKCHNVSQLQGKQSWAWAAVHLLSHGDWGAQGSSQRKSYRTEKQIKRYCEEGSRLPSALQWLL